MTQGISAPASVRVYQNIIIENNGCWTYQGATNNAGYGFIRDGKKMRTAHRVSYEAEHNVELPSTTWIGHTCYNYRCVNPAHLYEGNRNKIVKNMVANARHSREPHRTGPHKRKNCIHCGTEMAVNLIDRYHNDNCKNKPLA